MQKCVCIPVERYELMLATYDKVVKELEDAKKALEEAAVVFRIDCKYGNLGSLIKP